MFPDNLASADFSGPAQFVLAAGVAVAAAAPLGPISILTIQRAVSMGFWRAFWPTLGAVTADGLFGFLAALGSGYLTDAVMAGRFWLRLAGSAILAAMGLRLYIHQRKSRELPGDSFGLGQLGLLNFTLVLSNPLTLGFYMAAFTLIGLGSPGLLTAQSLLLGAGIITGSLLWFGFISLAASKFHMKLSETLLDRFRAGLGIGFIILGLVSAGTAIVRRFL